MSNTIADKLCRDWFDGRAYNELSEKQKIDFDKNMGVIL